MCNQSDPWQTLDKMKFDLDLYFEDIGFSMCWGFHKWVSLADL